MFGIPVALEAFKASKEVLVRRPAPPGIRPFLENKRSIQWLHVKAAGIFIMRHIHGALIGLLERIR